MTRTTIVDITPDKSLMQKIGAAGYRTEQAVSELVDNAIDARLPSEPERINVMLDFVNRTITVADDGRGMTLGGLRQGLTIARTGDRPQSGADLGAFGIGLKSACSALGKSFTIVTSTEHSKAEHVAEYDEDAWLHDRARGWSNFEVKSRPRTGAHRGTSITISRLKVPLYPNQTTAFKKSFGIRYGAYLRSAQVMLYVNSRPCLASDPSVEDGSRRDLEIPLPSGGTVRGWIGLLRKRSVKGDYGLHLYRNDRLIKAFDKFGMRAHPEVAKVVGELHLDHVPVNFSKSGFLTESPEYAECVSEFKRHPEVERVMRGSPEEAPASDSLVQSILDYSDGGGAAGAPLPRMGRSRAGRIMKEGASYLTGGAAGPLEVVFRDGSSDDLYGVEYPERRGAPCRIVINRKSPVFRAAANPLFLVGMIRAEADLLASDRGGGGGGLDDLVKRRNKLWCRFARDWSPQAAPSRRPDFPAWRGRSPLIPGYGLAAELVEVHDFVGERFGDPFQFTALSTLAAFLHSAYARMPYHLFTNKGRGERLHDLVSGHWGDEFTVLLNPGEIEARTAMDVSGKDRFIVVREFARPVSGTWAEPAKAWLDLAAECRRGWMAGYRQELAGILEGLLERGMVKEGGIRSAARNRRMTKAVDECMGGAQR